MDDWERRQKLEQALLEAVQPRELTPAEQRISRRANRKRNPAVTVAVLVLGWAFIAWIWLARPTFVFGPGVPPPPTAEVREASLRFALYLQRRRIEAFVTARGRLPTALAQTGPVEDGVSYQSTGDGYVLVGQRGDLTLRLPSTMDPEVFLGGSLGVLRR